MIQSIKNFLKLRLKNDLPGAIAHDIMSPISVSDKMYNTSRKKNVK